MQIKTAAIIGFGAIGCVYGRHLIKYMGDDFAVIAGGKRGDKLRENGIVIDGETLMPNVISPDDNNFKAGLIILSVKNYALDSAIEDIKNIVTPETILLPIFNGIAGREKLAKAFPENTVFYGLCRTDALRTDGGIICSWEGPIEFGNADNHELSSEVKAVKDLFDASGVKNDVCTDMQRAVWLKFMRNVSMNQLAAVTGLSYDALRTIPEMSQSVKEIMTEVVNVARGEGIDLRYSDVEECYEIMAASSGDAKPSTLQDVEAGRPLETDIFAGSVIEEGKKAGVATPWNDVIYKLLKIKEASYTKQEETI